MTALERKFQRHIKRVLIIIVGFIVFVFGFQYKSMHKQAVGVIENQVTSISFELNAIFERIETQSNLMQKFATRRLETLDKNLDPNRVKSAFLYEASSDTYELSRASELISFDTAGNLFGTEVINKNDIDKLSELKMSLELFDVQHYGHSKDQLGVVSFYVSQNNFFTIHPSRSLYDVPTLTHSESLQTFFESTYQKESWTNNHNTVSHNADAEWLIESNGVLSNTASMVYALPVVRHGEFKGIVGAEFEVINLQHLLMSTDFKSGNLYFVDKDGKTLFAWNYNTNKAIENTSEIPQFYENLNKDSKQGNWFKVKIGDKPFNLIYEVNEKDISAIIFPNMAMMFYFCLGLIVFILINRHILTTQFFRPAIKIYEYLKMVSSQQDTSKLDVPKEWKQWLSEINDVLSLMSVSQSIPGAIIQVGYEDEVYTIQFLGEGLEHRLSSDKQVKDLIGKSIFELAIEKQRWTFETMLEQSKDHMLPIQHEFILDTDDETPIWLSFISSPRKTEEGRYIWEGILLDVSDRKILEEELQTEKQFVEDLLDTTGAIFSVRNSEYKLVRCNQSYLQLSGYSIDEVMMNDSLDEDLLGDEYELVYKKFDQVLNGEPPQVYENHWLNKEGEKRLIHWTNTGLNDRQGKVEYIISTGIDITERELAQNELRETLKEIEAIINNSLVGILLVKKYSVIKANDVALEILGYEADEIAEIHASKLFGTETSFEEFMEVYVEQISRGGLIHLDYQVMKKNGQLIDCRISGKAIDDDDLTKGVIFIIDDITEIRKVDNALRLSEARFRGIYDNLASGIGLVDSEGNYIEVNDKWTKLLGYSSAEVKEMSFLDITHPSEKDISWDNFKAMIERPGGGSYRIEKRYRHKDGDYIWCDLATSVIVDEKDPFSKVTIGIITDITARKRAEEQLFVFNKNLEKEKNKVEKLAKDQKLLFEMFEVFKDAPDLDGMFNVLTRLLPQVLNYDNMVVAIKKSKSDEKYIVKDYKGELINAGQDKFMYNGKGIIGKVLKDKKLYVANDLRMDPYYVPHSDSIKSMVGIPIMYRDYVWGIMSLDSETLNAFDEVSQEVLSILATHMALHLEEINSKTDLSIQAERLRALHEVVKEMVTERNNARIAKKISDEKLFPYTAVYAYENNKIELLAEQNDLGNKLEYPDDLFRKVIETKETQSLIDANEVNQMLIPIYFGKNIYGFFHLCTMGALTESDQEIASIISEQLSLFWELNMLIERTEFEALIDPLTAVWNRRYMINRLEQEDNHIYRYGGNACVALMDLGDFKAVNDRYGHAVGDEVLARTAEVIKENIRRSDFVGRYGGDEFIVFFPNTSYENGELFMKRIIQRISDIHIANVKEHVVADYGLACSPADGESLISAINIADERMYKNKRERKRAQLLNP